MSEQEEDGVVERCRLGKGGGSLARFSSGLTDKQASKQARVQQRRVSSTARSGVYTGEEETRRLKAGVRGYVRRRRRFFPRGFLWAFFFLARWQVWDSWEKGALIVIVHPTPSPLPEAVRGSLLRL